jgi:hypothetical protein
MISRGEAVTNARKMLRGFAGAPDQRHHAQKLFSELTHAEGWSAAEQVAITAFGLWLQARPSLDELKPHCERLLAKFG